MSNIYKKLSVGNLMAMAVTLPMVANTTNTASSPLLPSAPDAQKAAQNVKAGDVQILRINPTLVEIVFANQQRVAVDFYGESVFRIFEDRNDGVMRAPEAKPEASILVDNPRTALNHKQVKVEENDNSIILSTTKAQVIFDKATQLFKIINLENGKTVAEQSAPAQFTPEKVTLSLREQPDEYFFGGGVQNGRFSHKGEKIEIVNTNNWVDGGVASPAPFYWSTAGYGFMWYTFKPGLYDFGSTQSGKVELSHESRNLDVFFMVGKKPTDLLDGYYQLTGNPVLLPKFGFYEGHLNAYNRDYWKEADKGRTMVFEDGKAYKESASDKTGIKESLNGEKNNYQFSARAAIDRYVKQDMPLGWFLPNDGYGAGYGQESTLDGNIQNLKEFGDYARKHGVEIGLWTQSDLHPKDSIEALLQRDIVKEVGTAGVRVLKTDVAWVGDGYSFGLNGVADVAQIMPYYGGNARPFIISLDGWAGTQRYASVWSGDQTGGELGVHPLPHPYLHRSRTFGYLQHHMRQRRYLRRKESDRQHARVRMEGLHRNGSEHGWLGQQCQVSSYPGRTGYFRQPLVSEAQVRADAIHLHSSPRGCNRQAAGKSDIPRRSQPLYPGQGNAVSVHVRSILPRGSYLQGNQDG